MACERSWPSLQTRRIFRRRGDCQEWRGRGICRAGGRRGSFGCCGCRQAGLRRAILDRRTFLLRLFPNLLWSEGIRQDFLSLTVAPPAEGDPLRPTIGVRREGLCREKRRERENRCRRECAHRHFSFVRQNPWIFVKVAHVVGNPAVKVRESAPRETSSRCREF